MVSKWFQKTATAGDEHMSQRMRRILAQDLACLSAQISGFNNNPVKSKKKKIDSDALAGLSALLVCHFCVLIWSLMFMKAHLNFQMLKE